MLDHALESVKWFIRERFASPLFYCVAFPWLVYNWQIWVILFWSDDKVTHLQVISEIGDVIARPSSYVVPACISVGLLLFYPGLAALCTLLWEKVDIWRNNVLKTMTKRRLVTEEERANLLNEISDRAALHDRVVGEKEVRIKQLEEAIAEANSKLKKITDEANKNRTKKARRHPVEELSGLELAVLRRIQQHPNSSIDKISSLFPWAQNQIAGLIHSLHAQGLAEPMANGWVISPVGLLGMQLPNTVQRLKVMNDDDLQRESQEGS